MKNKIVIIALALIVAVVFIVVFIIGKEKVLTDGEKFKEEYESLNGTKSSSGKTIRSILISKDNRVTYSSVEEILKMMDKKEDFAIYFGFASCPWCRSILPTLIDVVNDLELDTIYYVDVTDIRDTLALDKNNEVVIEKRGTDSYYQLLERLDKLLSDYKLTNEDGEEIETGEKRIYAPNIVSVIDGKAKELTTGISDKQTDGYMELTSEMNKDMYNKIKCALECLAIKATTCTKNAC